MLIQIVREHVDEHAVDLIVIEYAVVLYVKANAVEW
jgi:hypothetical protein